MDPLSAQQYCLRWNNHQNNLLTVFEDHLNSEAFVDVTLACDSKVLKAHKLVLSACSPYFQSLLFNNPDRHPIVFLKDVKFSEMRALLEFMYRGEVSVDQDSLGSLLKVAESLRIKGLAEVSYDRRATKFSDVEEFSQKAMLDTSRHPNLPLAPVPKQHLKSQDSEVISGNNKVSSASLHSPSGHLSLGPKRKRGRPRRLSGSEAVPLAFRGSNLSGIRSEITGKSCDVISPKGSMSPQQESSEIWTTSDFLQSAKSRSKNLKDGPLSDKKSLYQDDMQRTQDFSKEQIHSNLEQQLIMEDQIYSAKQSEKHKKLKKDSFEAIADEEMQPLEFQTVSGMRGFRSRGRGGRRGRHRGDRVGSRSMSEMSVRGLDLLRYATVSPDGTFCCIECDRMQVSKQFKNKYSFQRHAFLYHEGAARKVFPCLVCFKEFSRPDKMKQHLKMMHESRANPKEALSKSPSLNSLALAVPDGDIEPTSSAPIFMNPFQAILHEAVNMSERKSEDTL